MSSIGTLQKSQQIAPHPLVRGIKEGRSAVNTGLQQQLWTLLRVHPMPNAYNWRFSNAAHASSRPMQQCCRYLPISSYLCL